MTSLPFCRTFQSITSHRPVSLTPALLASASSVLAGAGIFRVPIKVNKDGAALSFFLDSLQHPLKTRAIGPADLLGCLARLSTLALT